MNRKNENCEHEKLKMTKTIGIFNWRKCECKRNEKYVGNKKNVKMRKCYNENTRR